VQLGVLGHARLHEQHRAARIDAGGEPVDDHVLRVRGHLLRVFVLGGQRVPVGGEEKARFWCCSCTQFRSTPW